MIIIIKRIDISHIITKHLPQKHILINDFKSVVILKNVMQLYLIY